MKFVCDKLLLLAAIITATHVAPIKSPVITLEGLLLEAEDNEVRITGYDLKTAIVTSVPAEVEEKGGIVLNARLFGEIVRKMSGQNVTISVNSGYVATLESELSDFEILGSPVSDYPDLPSVEELEFIEIDEGILKDMISQTRFAISDNESRPIHTGALFEINSGELTVVAVDGFRLALRRESMKNTDTPSCSFVVPGAALSELERISSDDEGTFAITLGAKHIIFSKSNITLISRRLEGEFLNYKNSIPQDRKHQITVDKSEMIKSVERVSVIINDTQLTPLKCLFSDGIAKFYAASAVGKANDECAIGGNGEDLEIGFNYKYLLDALKAAPADEIVFELTNGITPCVISPVDESDSFLYLILPVRLKSYDG